MKCYKCGNDIEDNLECQFYEDEWVSNNGMSVKLKDNIAVIVEDIIDFYCKMK